MSQISSICKEQRKLEGNVILLLPPPVVVSLDGCGRESAMAFRSNCAEVESR